MPEISRFYGIVIRMYGLDHAPPHLHAVYAEHEALIGIENIEVIRGTLPPRPTPRLRVGGTPPGRVAGRLATGTAPRASGQDRPARLMPRKWSSGRRRRAVRKAKTASLAGQWREQRAEAERLDAEIEANIVVLGF